MGYRLVRALKKILASYSISDIQSMAQGIINQFFPEIEMPEIRIINHTHPTYIGNTKFVQKKDEKPTLTVELQKSILDDERTVHRTLAHELIHVWQYSNADIREKLLSSEGRYEQHGKSFNLMADKINAVYGKGYITEKSDATDVISQEKEFYILIQPHKDGIFGVTKFLRPSEKQKKEIQRRLQEGKAHIFKTKEKLFTNATDLNRFGGYSIYSNEDLQARLAEMYEMPNLDNKFQPTSVSSSWGKG